MRTLNAVLFPCLLSKVCHRSSTLDPFCKSSWHAGISTAVTRRKAHHLLLAGAHSLWWCIDRDRHDGASGPRSQAQISSLSPRAEAERMARQTTSPPLCTGVAGETDSCVIVGQTVVVQKRRWLHDNVSDKDLDGA
jgi:hypothetical protein